MTNPVETQRTFLTGYTAVSGAFFADSDSCPILYNQKLSTPPLYSEKMLPRPDSVKVETFGEADFIDYAITLKRASEIIAKAKPDLVLVPMRGAIRPWQHLRICCNISSDSSVLFPFTHNEKHSDETRALIAAALAQCNGREHVSIVCIDCAKGGQGSECLVKILDDLHSQFDRMSRWNVTFCLFVTKERENVGWKYARQQQSKANFRVACELLGVAKLIGEDMEEAMIVGENFGPLRELKIEKDATHYLIETTQLPGVIDTKIAEAMHFALLCEPFHSLIDIRDWSEKQEDDPLKSRPLCTDPFCRRCLVRY